MGKHDKVMMEQLMVIQQQLNNIEMKLDKLSTIETNQQMILEGTTIAVDSIGGVSATLNEIKDSKKEYFS